MAVGIFAAVIGGSMVAGAWEFYASAAPPAPVAATGLPDPGEIKGWRTLQEVSEIWGVPQAILYRETGLDPATTPPSTQIKAREGRPAPSGQTLDRSFIADLAARWQRGELK